MPSSQSCRPSRIPSIRVCTRWMAVGKSTRTSPVWTPNSAARRAWCATTALARSALVGRQPWFRQVPPTLSISTSKVR